METLFCTSAIHCNATWNVDLVELCKLHLIYLEEIEVRSIWMDLSYWKARLSANYDSSLDWMHVWDALAYTQWKSRGSTMMWLIACVFCPASLFISCLTKVPSGTVVDVKCKEGAFQVLYLSWNLGNLLTKGPTGRGLFDHSFPLDMPLSPYFCPG